MRVNPAAFCVIPDHFKTQEMCIKAVEAYPEQLHFVPDQYKTKEMCERAFEENPYTLEDIPDHFKTREMCERGVEEDPGLLECVPDHFKTQKMCDGVVGEDPYSLQYVPDWFVTQKQVKTGHKDADYCNVEEVVECYDNFKKRRALKEQIGKVLASIKMVGLVYTRECEKRDRKAME